jgi:hypothetical protein
MNRPTDRLNVAEAFTSTSIATGLGLLAALRRGKPVHPKGAVYDARLTVTGARAAPPAQLLAQAGEHRAVVRFSRSVGLPEPFPDLLGMSIRVLDAYGAGAHQDLMLISSVDLPVLHHIFVPVRDAWQAPYSSSLPFRAGGDRFLIGALPRLEGPAPPGDTEFERLDAAATEGRLGFDLAVAPLEGRFAANIVGRLQLGSQLSADLDALRFNPWNTGGGLEPAGWLQAARYQAYRRSQAAWRRTQADGAQNQNAAEAELQRLA